MMILVPFFILCSNVRGGQFLPPYARNGELARLYPELLPNRGEPYPDSSTKAYITVPYDHFDSSVTKTFKDKYYYDETYFDSSGNGPIFVHMGGEGASGGVRAGQWERDHKALAVGVEHRFYGESTPGGDRSTANMKYLSVEQNLADTAAIIDLMQKKYGDKNRVVVTFGGSYSGATSAWMRIRYPDKVHASYSSSGVVNAILNFIEFDQQVGTAVKSPRESCHTQLAASSAALEREFKKDPKALKQKFGATNLIGTKMGDSDFWYAVADAEAMADQYGHKSSLCNALANMGSHPTDEQYANGINSWINSYYGSSFVRGCFYDSECLKDTSKTGMDRSWRWQKCTELAYLQPAPPTDSMRAYALTLEVLVEQCKYVFGDDIVPDVDTFNKKFGGDNPKGSKIVFMNYSDDPWQRASVNRTISKDLPWCMTTCDGCGHCGSGVPSSLHKCADEARQHISTWIAEASHATTA